MKVIYIRDSQSSGYLRIGFFDGEEKVEYTVSESDYRDLGSLLVGDAVEDIEQFRLSDMRYRAKLSALRILSYGDSNTRTLKRKLVLRSISPDIASDICNEMVGLGYVNECRQLEKLIENEANIKLSGRKRIFQKMLSKGYKKSDIESVLECLISHGIVNFEKSKQKLIEKKFPQGASAEEIRALLYKNGSGDTSAPLDF